VPYDQDSSRIVPVTISLAIAIVCVIILTVMIRDRWHRPAIKAAEQAQYETTGSTAGKADAKLVSNGPKVSGEPTPSAPDPVQPAKPD